MTDINDSPTFSCDLCQVPVILESLLRFGKEHVCRSCHDRISNEANERATGDADVTIESWPHHYKGFQVGVPIGIKATHRPSGLTAACDSERSMLANRTAALKMLKESPEYLEWREANERARDGLTFEFRELDQSPK